MANWQTLANFDGLFSWNCPSKLTDIIWLKSLSNLGTRFGHIDGPSVRRKSTNVPYYGRTFLATRGLVLLIGLLLGAFLQNCFSPPSQSHILIARTNFAIRPHTHTHTHTHTDKHLSTHLPCRNASWPSKKSVALLPWENCPLDFQAVLKLRSKMLKDISTLRLRERPRE